MENGIADDLFQIVRFFVVRTWNARQDAAPKCEAFREARRDCALAAADKSKLQDAILI